VEWFEIRVAVDGERKEAVSNRLFELGARGVSDADSPGVSRLVGYFDGKSAPAALKEMSAYMRSLAALFGLPAFAEPELAPVAEADWVELHKEFYKAQKLSSHFFLIPAWDKETRVPGDMIPLVLELGQAFGTGLHQSTQLAMHLTERILGKIADCGSIRLIDVGTGTGILAIAAEKLGVRQIEAMDIDPIAVECAKENLALNGCQNIHLFTGELAQVKGPAEVIISNILLEVHVGLAATYQKLVKPKGRLVLSGLLTPQLPEVDSLLTRHGFVCDETRSNGEWSAACYRRLS